MVPKGGLEPPRVTSHAPQTCASTNSATSANIKTKLTRMKAQTNSLRYDPSTSACLDLVQRSPVQRWRRVMQPEMHFQRGLETAPASAVVRATVQPRARLTAVQSAFQL